MTEYKIRVCGVTQHWQDANGDVHLTVTLPTESEETEFIHVDRGDDVPMLGVLLAHGEAAAGWWPDGECWSDEIRVPNPIGVFDG